MPRAASSAATARSWPTLSAKAIHAPWERAPLEMQGRDYPRPIVDHCVARERTLARYAVVKTRALP